MIYKYNSNKNTCISLIKNRKNIFCDVDNTVVESCQELDVETSKIISNLINNLGGAFAFKNKFALYFKNYLSLYQCFRPDKY